MGIDKRTIFFYLTFVLFLQFRLFSIAQVTTISRDWKFFTGDSLEWADPAYQDAHWKDIKAGLWWAHAGYDYSGFAWYRKKIFIPTSIKPAVLKNGYIKLNLGQIQDVDQTFFNGKYIGSTGSIDPYLGKWQEPRIYLIKPGLIRWDAENIIAVRVFGKNRNGGMHTGPYSFEPYNITFRDFIKILDARVEPDDNNGLKFTILFRNTGRKDFKGNLTFQVNDFSGENIRLQSQKIIIPGDQTGENEFSFYYNEPDIPVYSVRTVFSESRSHYTIEKKIIICTSTDLDLPVRSKPSVAVNYIVPDIYTPVAIENLKIEGFIGGRMDINLNKRLLHIDEQELLSGYLNRPGKQNWIGEHVGKYLEAACNSWSYNQDPRLKSQMDRIIWILLHTQEPDGYLGTYTPEFYWTNWDVWSHKYNLTGLLSYFKSTGYTPALEAAKKIGDLMCKTFGEIPGQLDIIESGTHVGMASSSILDPMVDLYLYTGDQKYLDFAHYIIRAYNHADGPEIIHSLMEEGKVNHVANGKAYELLSNLIGITKLYKVTGEEELIKAVYRAWEDITRNRLYITGTSSSNELFREDHELPAGFSDHMGEGCVTTHWLKLNYQLFTLTGDNKYFDEIEKTIYNHLLGAQNPGDGCVSYYTPLLGLKNYSCDITCCLSSIPTGISMIPFVFYGKRAGVPTLLSFEPGQISDTVYDHHTHQPVAFNIKTMSSFPESGRVSYILSLEREFEFPLAIRIPSWAANVSATIGGKSYDKMDEDYLIIERKWESVDTIMINFNIPTVILHGGVSYPDKIAFKRGPQVLAMDRFLNPLISPDSTMIRTDQMENLNLVKIENDLPSVWTGSHLYVLKTEAKMGIPDRILLVPFSEAGQTGEEITVWINSELRH